MNKFIKISIAALSVVLIVAGCSTLKQISQTIDNMKRLEFKLGDVSGFRLAGVNLTNKTKISDLSVSDGLKLTSAFAQRRLPAEFILNVDARNPNDGTKQNTNTNASITNFEWRLIIDDVPTITGNIASPVSVPGKGQTTVIPLSINIDLFEFFGNQGYDRIINLATAIGGGGNSSRLKLDAKPTVKIGSFPITYPGRLTIVNHEFRDK